MLQLMRGPLSHHTPTSLTFQQFPEYLSLITSSGLVHRLWPPSNALHRVGSLSFFRSELLWHVLRQVSLISLGSKSLQC